MLLRIARKTLISIVGRLPFLEALVDFLPSRKNSIKIIAYHRINNIPTSNYPFDSGLINASCEEFEEQVKYIKRYFNPITFTDLKNLIDNNLTIPKRTILITFDDGFEDNYTNAFKILSKHSVKATFFVSAGLMGQDELFWFERINYILRNTSESTIENIDGTIIDLSENKNLSINKISETMKLFSNDKMRAYILNLEKKLGIQYNESDLNFSKTMNWEQIIEMSDAGMEIGSHSYNHPILSRLSLEELKEELSLSKITIEKHIGKKVISLAYPNGDDASVGKTVEEVANNTGYTFGLKYGHEGTNYFPVDNFFRMKRMGILNRYKGEMFRLALNYPSLIL